MKPVDKTRLQRGISLIESLVAIVIAALGILGILGVQMRTLTDTTTTVRRAQAIRMIEDLGERMKVNPNGLADISTYVSAFGDTAPPPVDCAAGCDHTQLAKHDLEVWKRTIKDTLPLGRAEIFVPPAESGVASGQGRQLGVMIAWRENERDGLSGTDKEQTDATKVTGTGGTLIAGATLACPDKFTCHLQYIPVAARCAPYNAGGGTTTYFCPGS